MGLRWFNFIGFLMLFVGLFLNELVFLNIWYGANYFLAFVAAVYYGGAVCLSLWGGSRLQEA
ncbi:MAG: hypothetical protein AB7P24_02360 [Nitrospira sp.]